MTYFVILVCIVAIIYLEVMMRKSLNNQYRKMYEMVKDELKQRDAYIKKLEALLYSGDDE